MGEPKWVGTTGALIEQPGSPRTELADRWSRTRTYKGPYSLCESSALIKGTLGSGDDAGWVVTSSVFSKERGAVGTLVINFERFGAGSGTELPPQQFTCEPQRISRPLKYHPHYAELTEAELENIDRALEGDTQKGNEAYESFAGNGQTPANALALELYNKRKRGQETYYLSGLKYSYTTASFTLPTLTLGGFLEAPGGPMISSLPEGSSWLRMADDVRFNGSYFEVTRSWIGSPIGDWDATIYAALA